MFVWPTWWLYIKNEPGSLTMTSISAIYCTYVRTKSRTRVYLCTSSLYLKVWVQRSHRSGHKGSLLLHYNIITQRQRVAAKCCCCIWHPEIHIFRLCLRKSGSGKQTRSSIRAYQGWRRQTSWLLPTYGEVWLWENTWTSLPHCEEVHWSWWSAQSFWG